MKFAFSTVSCPNWDFETIASRAKEYGYDGVEVRGFLDETILTASNVFLTEPRKLRALFDYHGVKLCCLSSSIAMSGKARIDRRRAQEARTFIDTANQLGCPMVKVFDSQVMPGGVINLTKLGDYSRASAGVALGEWLLPLGDYAAARDVVIVVENALSFRDSKEMWMILDRLSHPSIACCWDVFNAALIGESPYLSVPTLNSKIAYTQVRDAKLGPLGASYCKLGEGDVPVQKFLTRLRGIGYDGWVTLEWDKAWLPNIAEPEDILPDSIKKLREWTKPQEEEEKPKKKEPAAAH
ncbi:MAG: sugar phosphate isomerase/epimerase family protein [Tepidisphaeraceae bacterium]